MKNCVMETAVAYGVFYLQHGFPRFLQRVGRGGQGVNMRGTGGWARIACSMYSRWDSHRALKLGVVFVFTDILKCTLWLLLGALEQQAFFRKISVWNEAYIYVLWGRTLMACCCCSGRHWMGFISHSCIPNNSMCSDVIYFCRFSVRTSE